MKAENLLAEDSFEAAREAFFGTRRTPPIAGVSPAEPLKPGNEPPAMKPLSQEDTVSTAASDHGARGLAQDGDAQWEWLLCLACTFRALRKNTAPLQAASSRAPLATEHLD